MNLHIKNKFKLIDLAKLGTLARKYENPYVMFSDPKYGIFDEGDMLDANTTYSISKQMTDEILNQILKHVILTLAEYDALETYEPNTLYLIVADLEETE